MFTNKGPKLCLNLVQCPFTQGPFLEIAILAPFLPINLCINHVIMGYHVSLRDMLKERKGAKVQHTFKETNFPLL